jgi:hypothetical protein
MREKKYPMLVMEKKTLKLTYDSYHKLKTKEKLGCHRSDRIEE